MRLVQVAILLSAAMAAALPASAQTWGTTRIPPGVQELKNAPDQAASPDTTDAEMTPILAPAGQRSNRGSQTLGDGTKDPAARRMEETAAGLIPPGGVMGMEPGPGDARGAPTVTGGWMKVRFTSMLGMPRT